MLISIDVKFIFDTARLGLFSTADILQIANVTLKPLFRLVLTVERSEMCAIFVFTINTTQPRPQVFSVYDALT